MKRIIYYEHPIYFLYWLVLVKKVDIEKWAIDMKNYDVQNDENHPIKRAVDFIEKYKLRES